MSCCFGQGPGSATPAGKLPSPPASSFLSAACGRCALSEPLRPRGQALCGLRESPFSPARYQLPPLPSRSLLRAGPGRAGLLASLTGRSGCSCRSPAPPSHEARGQTQLSAGRPRLPATGACGEAPSTRSLFGPGLGSELRFAVSAAALPKPPCLASAACRMGGEGV